ncbi:MAG TPA: aminotransferase class I/II-fold pyridoxal phosphate-dependent enzyme [Vicinamibacterales bacterium]|nr:aminotransferase class I/II-fold pyridoxal phosphate-dependent enzyme [Vicinamibacterales bacterium]
MSINRRRFLAAASLPALAFGAARVEAIRAPADAAADRTVRLSGDGVGLTPPQYAALLTRLLDEKSMTPDSYSLGGIVEELETQCARLLGKERAIFMPTGTLANHMAVRALAGGSSRVVVQEQSHFYQDEGDCAQTLSNLTLMPLAAGRATFTADDLQQLLDHTKSARVVSRVSVIAVETPVRRMQGAHFDAGELAKIIAIARREGIRLHLDGARLFLQAAYTGEDVAAYARPFDTVYVSLYKYFNAASGAILAGPRDVIDGMFHGRRMFGGGLNTVWPFALVARHYLDGFSQRYGTAVRISEDVIRGLPQDAFAVERIPSGTNLFRLRVRGTDPTVFRKRLAERGVLLSPPQGDTFLVGVNETLNRTTAPELVDAFRRARA